MFAYGEKLIDHDDLISAWPVGLMDKASASGAGDSKFESWAGHLFSYPMMFVLMLLDLL